MQSQNNKRGRVRLRIETLIMIFVIICLSFMMNYDHKVWKNNVISITEVGKLAMLNQTEDIEYFISKKRPIINIERNACKSVEVIDKNLNSVDMVVFRGTYLEHNEIKDDPRIQQAIRDGTELELDIDINGKHITAHLHWVHCGGNDFLILHTLNRDAVTEQIVFNIVGYITITLCFLLLLIHIYWQLVGVSNRYKKSVNEIYDRIR